VCTSQTWDRSLVQHSVTLLQKIWNDRNVHLHGSSKAEAAQKLRERVLHQDRQVYAHPPKLHKRLSAIRRILLHDRLRRSTTNLQRWLSRIHHQHYVSRRIQSHRKSDQLSLISAYRRANISITKRQKYPP